MPFSSFALPFFHPRRWDMALWLVLLPVLAWMQSHPGSLLLTYGELRAGLALSEPWRLLTFALLHPEWMVATANAAGLVVGMTMAARCIGPGLAWLGIFGSALLPGLWLGFGLEGSERMVGASTLLYGCLGMALVSWLRMRHELTYAERRDLMVGFATWLLVAFALSVPLLLQSPVRGVHAVGFLWGALLVAISRRHWAVQQEVTETGFPVPAVRQDRAAS